MEKLVLFIFISEKNSQSLYIKCAYKTMKVYLCGEKGCCPYVEIRGGEVIIGEEGNMCILTREQFNELKKKIIEREL